jgi:Fic family protein
MNRRTDIRRDSRPTGPELFTDAEQKSALEARNGLLQFDEVKRLVEAGLGTSPFRLRPSVLQSLQRIAVQDIYVCAGNWRTFPVTIAGTNHQPPPAAEVATHVEEMCDYVAAKWHRSAIHLAAYLMWRLNWIHPFAGGNGRTSRALSYFVLCVRAGTWLGGTRTIPEQIVENRQPYYAALDAADAACERGEVDVAAMEELLERLLAAQLLSAHADATRDKEPDKRSG